MLRRKGDEMLGFLRDFLDFDRYLFWDLVQFLGPVNLVVLHYYYPTLPYSSLVKNK
jgi:hypothetical protein